MSHSAAVHNHPHSYGMQHKVFASLRLALSRAPRCPLPLTPRTACAVNVRDAVKHCCLFFVSVLLLAALLIVTIRRLIVINNLSQEILAGGKSPDLT